MNNPRITTTPTADNNGDTAEAFAERLAEEFEAEKLKTLTDLGNIVSGFTVLADQATSGAKPLDVHDALTFAAKMQQVAEAAARLAGECQREAGRWRMMALVAGEMPHTVLRRRGC